MNAATARLESAADGLMVTPKGNNNENYEYVRNACNCRRRDNVNYQGLALSVSGVYAHVFDRDMEKALGRLDA